MIHRSSDDFKDKKSAPIYTTDGDTIVQFRESEVLVAGNIVDLTSYPVIDVDKGGSLQGEVDALNWMLDTAVV